ncbi:MAG: TIGR03643 family protein [Betaproteobacteria bacterium]|nr:TIGR03643 family protein [Betaproteobacteria bacterium]
MPNKKSTGRRAELSAGDISAVIQMAWEDRTTFETIQERIGISEPDVIKIMRSELKPDSFKLLNLLKKCVCQNSGVRI